MGQKSSTSGGVGFVVGAVVVLGLSLLTSAVAIGAAPGITRVTAPVVCPSGTTESAVAIRGTRKITWYLYCLDADGVGREPRPVFIFFTLVGQTTLVLGALAGVMGLALRRRS